MMEVLRNPKNSGEKFAAILKLYELKVYFFSDLIT